MKKLIFIFLFIFLLFGSCSEKKEVVPYSFSEILTGEENKTWRFIDFFVLQDDFQSLDYGVIFGDCYDDDSFTFYNNPSKSFESTTGDLKCDFGAIVFQDVNVTSRWSLVNANSTIIFPFKPMNRLYDAPAEAGIIFTLISISEKRMILEIPIEDVTFRFILESI